MKIVRRSVGLLCLSWSSPETTERSMASWSQFPAELIHERLVFYQEISSADRSQALRHRFDVVGGHGNIGLGRAMLELVRASTTEFVMFLECDYRLTARRPGHHLAASLDILERADAHLVRMRSATRPGWPVNSIVLKGSELDHDSALLDSCYWYREPSKVFPRQLTTVVAKGDIFTISASKYAHWNTNPALIRRDLLLQRLESCATLEVVEQSMNIGWSEAGLVVGQGRGLFTHHRVDGPAARSTPVRRLSLQVKCMMPAPAYAYVRRKLHGPVVWY
jgi:hypothetical protein